MEYLIVILSLFFTVWILSFVTWMVKIIFQVLFFPLRILGGIFFGKPRARKYIQKNVRPNQSIKPTKIKWKVDEKGYSSNWSWISRDFKMGVNWTCQQCHLYLGAKENRNLLHVHHMNRNPSDNSKSNLIALCVQCHSSQPGSGHKRIATASKTDGRWDEINRLRSEQRR